MKNIVLLMLLCMLFSSCGSNTSYDLDNDGPKKEKETTVKKEIGAIEAKELASDYVINNEWYFISAVNIYAVKDISSIKYLDIASIEFSEFHTASSPEIEFTVKGNFFGYDEYGSLVDQYVFSWDIQVEKDTGYVRGRTIYPTVKVK